MKRWLTNNFSVVGPERRMSSLDGAVSSDDCRTLADTLSGEERWADGSREIISDNSSLSPNGRRYFTIRQAAYRLGVPERKIRYLDERGHYSAVRASTVGLATQAIPGSTRMYLEEDFEQLRLALLRCEARSSGLKGEEITRKMAASRLGVSVGWLRRREDSGLLTPRRIGPRIVYGLRDLEVASALKKH